jgi:hypothetical protein
MTQKQNQQHIHNIASCNKLSENVSEFEYLGIATLRNRNKVNGEIRRRMNCDNACYSVQKLLSSHVLPKMLKLRMFKTIILPLVLYECETWSLTLREEHKQQVENRVLRKH